MDKRKYILEQSEHLKMTKVCEMANVGYSTFANWKSGSQTISDKMIDRLYETIKELPKGE